ncbi:MAG: hypothetical protein ABJN34_08320 [Litoreibacter sp.]|uniref:hypothetical protein n=1 Tax=Litoreibacter sp. TaxID=1969459 RepID=UPI00329958A8
MGNILLGIWENAPVWVWPLFVVLVIVGVMAMRDRKSSVIPYFFYPLFGLSAVNAVGGLSHVSVSWAAFGISYLIGAAGAFKWQDGLVVERIGWKMTLKGDRVTILILMLIFFSNFVNGVLGVVAPQVQAGLSFAIIFACVLGAGAGSFTGRALRVITLKGRVRSEVRP